MDSRKPAFWSAYTWHVALAVVACLVLALQVHLWAIDASNDVVGGAAFLLITIVGIPAIIFAILAVKESLGASDPRLSMLLVALAVPVVALFFEASPWILAFLQAAYILLVAAVGLVSRRNRTNEGAD